MRLFCKFKYHILDKEGAEDLKGFKPISLVGGLYI